MCQDDIGVVEDVRSQSPELFPCKKLKKYFSIRVYDDEISVPLYRIQNDIINLEFFIGIISI